MYNIVFLLLYTVLCAHHQKFSFCSTIIQLIDLSFRSFRPPLPVLSSETEQFPSLINFVTLKLLKQSEQKPTCSFLFFSKLIQIEFFPFLFTHARRPEFLFLLVLALTVVNETFSICSPSD